MIRPQLKDMYGGGMDARMSTSGKKKPVNPPPLNASPGELRLWRKLNGMLDDTEKKVDDHEHNKARCRQMKYPGTPARQAAASKAMKHRPSETDLLTYADVPEEELRQQKAPPRRGSVGGDVKPPRVAAISKAEKPKRPSGGGDRFSGPGSMYKASPPSSPKGARAGTPSRKAARDESPGRARPARKPSPRDASPRTMPPRAPSAAKPAKRKVAPPPPVSEPHSEEEVEPLESEHEEYDDTIHDVYDEGYEGGAYEETYEEAAQELEQDEPTLEEEPSDGLDGHGTDSVAESAVESDASSTPSPVATGSEQPARAKKRTEQAAGGGNAPVREIEKLMSALSLAQKRTLQQRLADMIEMHELREMIHN